MFYRGHEGATLRNGFTYSWVRGGPMLVFFLDLPWFQLAYRVRWRPYRRPYLITQGRVLSAAARQRLIDRLRGLGVPGY